MSILSFIFKKKQSADFKKLISEGAIVLDVRTPVEFDNGHVRGSINIPFQILSKMLPAKLFNAKAVIVCCQSGTRSGMAKALLEKKGIVAYNGGSWTDVQRAIV
ncbi:MAG: hypothetical protein C5B59_01620 [Bacteroidetes bacterium]|nr:MAG: hypothetical protein C5B59_01620 [Bacteroidota bacterium]